MVGILTFTNLVFRQSEMICVGENLAIYTAKEFYYNGNEQACEKAETILAGYHGYDLLSCKISESGVVIKISVTTLKGIWKFRKTYIAAPLFRNKENRDIIPSSEN